jgi:outer membrane protease
MKKYWLIISFILLLFLPVLAYSDNGYLLPGLQMPGQPYHFSLIPQAGIVDGISRELVYRSSSSEFLLSELRWAIDPLFYLGLSIRFAPEDPFFKWGFFAELNFKSGIPAQTGIMEDRDWMGLNSLGNTDVLSHFSQHENYTNRAFWLDLRTGLSFPLSEDSLLRPFLALSYMHFQWKAHNGYIQYADKISGLGDVFKPWDPSIPKDPISGVVVSYSQNWFIAGPGLGVDFSQDRFYIAFSFMVSPLVFCFSEDNHHLRSLMIQGIHFLSFAVEPALEVSFSFTKASSLGLSVSFRYIAETRGNSFYFDQAAGTMSGYRDISGTAYSALDLGLWFKITF